MTTKKVYTYLGSQSPNLEKVGVDVSLSIAARPGAPAVVKVTHAEGSGQILFDNRTGVLHENKVSQTMSMYCALRG